ncbi:MAG: cellulase family glycosylhydrolase [Chitinophagaceae bacterium]
MLALVAGARAQYLKADGKRIVDANNKEVLLRGMGLGGWMLQEPYMLQLSGVVDAQHQFKQKVEELIGKEKTAIFYDAWLKNHCTKTDIDSLAAWGFNCVRLPIHYNLFTLPVDEEPVPGKNTWLKKGFALTDSLLSWCAANHIYLILDLHAAPGGQGNDLPIADRDKAKPSLWQDEANREKTIALWKELATRYVNKPWIGGYDLLNETNWGFTNAADKNGCAEKMNEPLKKMLTDITAAIRTVDKKHILFLEGNCWANNYSGMFPLWDNNMAVSFHKYWNENNKGSIQGFLNIREQQNVPVWLGESGENSNVWFTDAISLLETNNIGWTWWPLKKLGGNNPFQVKQPAGYDKILNYWRGRGEKPTADEAYTTLMQLANNTKAQNNIYHKDVTDAMFRQVRTAETVPFKDHVISNNTVVYATDYDLGRNGVAYEDVDAANYRVSTGKNTEWNKGHSYRNDGVDIGACTDSLTNGYNVGWIEDGEWLQYTIKVNEAGVYDLNIRTAAANDKGKVQLEVNGTQLPQTIALPETGGNRQWATTNAGGVTLQKGVNKVRVKAVSGGFSFNYMYWAKKEVAGK